MSSDVVRELFRSLENTLHDRLKVIEDILSTTRSSSSIPSDLVDRLQVVEGHLKNLDEYTMSEVRSLARLHDQLEKRVQQVEGWMRTAAETLLTVNTTIGSLQKRMDDERPVEAAEVEAEIEETQEAALNADADASATERMAQKSFAKAVDQLQEEEEEVEEEEVEEEELELEEFTFKSKTYYRDQNLNVYIADEDGAVDPSEVVGIWNPKTKKIDRVPQA